MTTAKEVLNQAYKQQATDVTKSIEDIEVLAMKYYARQVAEAVRRKCIDVYNTSNGNDFEVMGIDIEQYIK